MREGLFLSGCKGLVSGQLDLPALAGEYKDLAVAKVFADFYDRAGFDALLNAVVDHKLESVVLGGDSPLSYRQVRNGEQLLDCIEQRGVDRNRIECVNFLNMVVRPHKASAAALQAKAKLLLDVGLEKVRACAALDKVEISPRKAVAVIGSSAGSLVAAQHLLDQGYKVHLVDEAMQTELLATDSPHVQATLAYVAHHPRFTPHPASTVLDFYGYPGDYMVRVGHNGEWQDVPVGAVVIAAERGRRLKPLQLIFHIDIDEDGQVAARDEVGGRSLTQERGVFLINPPTGADSGLSAEMLAADSAAAMVMNLLNRNEIYHPVTVSRVRTDQCGGCGACVKTCMFHAVSLHGKPAVSVIDPRRCRSCGNCVTACPAGARDLGICPSTYLFSAVDILARYQHAEPGHKILAIGCDGCGYRCLDRGATQGLSWPVGLMPLWVVCGGQIDTQLIMYAFTRGFDAVLLMICGEGSCHNLVGNVDMERRVNLLREILASRGVNNERLEVITSCSRKVADCVEKMHTFLARRVGHPESWETSVLR